MNGKAKTLEEEINQFQHNQEHIQQILNRAEGIKSRKIHLLVNSLSIVCITVLLIFDILREALNLHILPPLFALEIGLILISLKIIWMIHSNMKVTHFQFWILHSIETKLNELSKDQKTLMKKIQKFSPSQTKNNP